jgi:hypothetical protein
VRFGGGRGGRGGVGGALTRDGAAIEGARWGRAPTCERRKGGQCGGDEVRRARGSFYRCRGGGRRLGDGEVKATPLMAVRVSYRKRGRWRRPIKEG